MKKVCDALPGLEGFEGGVFGGDGMFRQVPALRLEAGDFLYWPADLSGRSRPTLKTLRRYGMRTPEVLPAALRGVGVAVLSFVSEAVVAEDVPDGSPRRRPRLQDATLYDLPHEWAGSFSEVVAGAVAGSLHADVCRVSGFRWRDLFGVQPLDDVLQDVNDRVSGGAGRLRVRPFKAAPGAVSTTPLCAPVPRSGVEYLFNGVAYYAKWRLPGAVAAELERRGVMALRLTGTGRRTLALRAAAWMLGRAERDCLKVLDDARVYADTLAAAVAMQSRRAGRLRRMRRRVADALGRPGAPAAQVQEAADGAAERGDRHGVRH